MPTSAEQIQIFYEIAMSIGSSLDLRKMLKMSISTYLRKLNCSAGSVFRLAESSKKTFKFEKIYSIPRNIDHVRTYQYALKNILPLYTAATMEDFRQNFPINGHIESEGYFHIMNLPDFGLFVLIKSGEDFDPYVLNSLKQLNQKLAGACKACIQNEELENAHWGIVIKHRQLKKKTTDLKAAQSDLLCIMEEMKKQKYALKASEELLSSTIASMEEVVFVLDKQGIFINYFQPQSEASFYVQPEFLLGKSYSEALPANVSKLFKKAIRKVIETETVQKIEYNLPMPEGNAWYSANVSIRKDSSGKFCGTTVVARDITTRKQAEEALRDSDRLKSDFVSTVSHELRTPLASILGFSGTILRDKSMNAATSEEFTRIIFEESRRLARLIENILDISRIESGRAGYTMIPLQLDLIVEEVIQTQKVAANKKHIKITSEIDKNLPEISADQDAIKQVGVNILGNAIKFTKEGGAVIVSLSQNGESISLRIQDNGVGIPKKDINKIFEKFYRVSRPGSVYQGTGIGLAIVNEIVKLHKGQIRVESKENQGTLFEIILPVTPVNHN